MIHDRLDTPNSARAAAVPVTIRQRLIRWTGRRLPCPSNTPSPAAPLDEHLRREQTRALLDLLTDHARHQRSKGAKN